MKNTLKSSLHTTHQFPKKYPNYPTFYKYVQYQLNYSSTPSSSFSQTFSFSLGAKFSTNWISLL